MHRARYAERQVKSGPDTSEGGLHRCAEQTAQDNSPPGTSHGRVYCCVRYTSVALAVNIPEVLRCLRTTVCHMLFCTGVSDCGRELMALESFSWGQH